MPFLKLKHDRSFPWILFIVVLFISFNSACSSQAQNLNKISVNILVDDQEHLITVEKGTNVQAALDQAKVALGNLDKAEPASYTIINSNIDIKITRVREEFEVEENTIPFSRQTMKNESLPTGQTMLIQPGINGLQQITYRRLLENGIQISRTIFKTTLLKESKPEIVMVGVQTPFTAISIPGRLAYLTAGNAWVMEKTTGGRRPVVTTGDLDGHIFTLSPDGNWLLYTRKPTKDDDPNTTLNTLWMVKISDNNPDPVYLRVKNIIHFAAWVPGQGLTITYSTVEPRSTSPGWQANNDLQLIKVNETGGLLEKKKVLEANSGGIYGWWGMDFNWSPSGDQLAFSRPDAVGIVDIEKGQLNPIINLIPVQTRSDWAWVPGIGWSKDSSVLYTITHMPSSGITSDETSPIFDVSGFNIEENLPIDIVSQAGMFAYPSISQRLLYKQFAIAYLQAIFPNQSETSRYRLMIMDRDGSNRESIFPPEGQPGIEPQVVMWQPRIQEGDILWIAFIYEGNLWLVNPLTKQSQQITGDGSIIRIEWR